MESRNDGKKRRKQFQKAAREILHAWYVFFHFTLLSAEMASLSPEAAAVLVPFVSSFVGCVSPPVYHHHHTITPTHLNRIFTCRWRRPSPPNKHSQPRRAFLRPPLPSITARTHHFPRNHTRNPQGKFTRHPTATSRQPCPSRHLLLRSLRCPLTLTAPKTPSVPLQLPLLSRARWRRWWSCTLSPGLRCRVS